MCGYVAKETAYNGVVREIQKLQKTSSENEARWENDKSKLNRLLSEKDQHVMVCWFMK